MGLCFVGWSKFQPGSAQQAQTYPSLGVFLLFCIHCLLCFHLFRVFTHGILMCAAPSMCAVSVVQCLLTAAPFLASWPSVWQALNPFPMLRDLVCTALSSVGARDVWTCLNHASQPQETFTRYPAMPRIVANNLLRPFKMSPATSKS